MLRAKVETINGLPSLIINGVRAVPSFFFTSTGFRDKEDIQRMQIRAAAEYGEHLISVSCSLPFHITPCDYGEALHAMDIAIESDPACMILLRVGLSIYGEDALAWGRTHPGDCMVSTVKRDKAYDNDMANEVSVVGNERTSVTLASDAWFEAADLALRGLHDLIKSNDRYNSHLLGYHIGAGETGEWFHFGLREKGVDKSETNRHKFSEWLEAKYGSSDTLCTAWGLPGDAFGFDDVRIPEDIPGNDRMEYPARTLFDLPGDNRYIDYCNYASQLCTTRIKALARTAREITQGEKLILFFYGYLFELYDARTGHFHLQELLDCPDIDAFSSPVSYTDRNHGGTGALMSPADTIAIHGKLWFVENDIRSPNVVRSTPKDRWDWVKSVDTLENYNDVLLREGAQMLIHGMGCWYMDLLSVGWQYHPMIWSRIRAFRNLYESVQDRLTAHKPDIAVVVDESSASLVAHADALGVNLLYRMRHAFYRAGVSFGLYTSADIEAGRVPSAKVFFLLNPFGIDRDGASRIVAAAKAQNAAVVVMHGVLDAEAAELLTGARLLKYSGGMAELTVKSVPGCLGGVMLNDLTTYRDMINEACPAFYAEPSASVLPLAIYCQGPLAGRIGLSLSRADGVQRVFAGPSLLTPAAIREICRLLGTHIYSESNDTFFAGSGIYALHAQNTDNPFPRTIKLPSRCALFDCTSGDVLAATDTLTFVPRPSSTGLWIDPELGPIRIE